MPWSNDKTYQARGLTMVNPDWLLKQRGTRASRGFEQNYVEDHAAGLKHMREKIQLPDKLAMDQMWSAQNREQERMTAAQQWSMDQHQKRVEGWGTRHPDAQAMWDLDHKGREAAMDRRNQFANKMLDRRFERHRNPLGGSSFGGAGPGAGYDAGRDARNEAFHGQAAGESDSRLMNLVGNRFENQRFQQAGMDRIKAERNRESQRKAEIDAQERHRADRARRALEAQAASKGRSFGDLGGAKPFGGQKVGGGGSSSSSTSGKASSNFVHRNDKKH